MYPKSEFKIEDCNYRTVYLTRHDDNIIYASTYEANENDDECLESDIVCNSTDEAISIVLSFITSDVNTIEVSDNNGICFATITFP